MECLLPFRYRDLQQSRISHRHKSNSVKTVRSSYCSVHRLDKDRIRPTQICAETWVRYEDILYSADTDMTPLDMRSYSSRQTYVAGVM